MFDFVGGGVKGDLGGGEDVGVAGGGVVVVDGGRGGDGLEAVEAVLLFGPAEEGGGGADRG